MIQRFLFALSRLQPSPPYPFHYLGFSISILSATYLVRPVSTQAPPIHLQRLYSHNPFIANPPDTFTMAAKALLVLSVLVNLGAAFLPPCLPGLGPDYCPDTTTTHYAPEPEVPLAKVAYPDQLYQEKFVQKELLPLLNKDYILELLRIHAGGPDENQTWWKHTNRVCYGKDGREAMEKISSQMSINLLAFLHFLPFF